MPSEILCDFANSQATCNCFESPLQTNISIGHSQHTGRCAIYNGQVPLKAGHVIMRNFPMATQLFANNRDGFCSYCLTTKPSLLRCSQCKMVWYCSKECQRLDWKKSGGHFLECSLLRFISTSNSDWDNEAMQDMCLFIRTWWYLGQHESCQQMGPSHSPTKLIKCGHAHWLLMDEDFFLHQHAHKYKQMSLFLEKFMQVTMDATMKKRPSINSTDIMAFWRKFHSNNFSIFNSVLTSFAAGVYPYAALLNHSCAPNCIVRFQIQSKQRPILEIVAAKDIQMGDELCHSYIDIIQGLNHGTDKILNQQYGWPSCGCSTCRCPKSNNGQNSNVIIFLDEETDFQTDHPWLNPFAWENLQYQKINSTPIVLEESLYLSLSLEESFQKELSHKIELLLADAAKCAYCDDQPELELQCIQRAYDIYTDNNLPPLGPQMYQILSRMLAPQLLLQNFSNALSTCQHLIACLCCSIQQIANQSIGDEKKENEYIHPLLGVQLFTLADLYEGNGRTSDATRAYQWSRRILRVSHGQASEMIQHLDSIL